jgi:hypothetical protein
MSKSKFGSGEVIFFGKNVTVQIPRFFSPILIKIEETKGRIKQVNTR